MAFKRHAVTPKVLNDLKKRSGIGIIFYSILAFVVLYSGDYYLQHTRFALLFFIPITSISLIRLVHVLLLFKKLERYSEKLNKFVFYCTVLLTPVVWGIGFAVFMIQSGDFYSKFLMVSCTVGLAAGGAVSYMPDRRLSIAFTLFILLPAAVIMSITGTYISLALMVLIFGGYMVLISLRGNKEYWNALEAEKSLQEKSDILKKLSRIDVLTGLYNRGSFDDALDAQWKLASREAKLLTMVIGDIDHFKKVNDTYGHLAGDEFLKYVAQTLKTTFKRNTDFVARYGGEEFVVLLPDTNSMIAFEMAEVVRKNLESGSIEYNQKKINSTISFGIASIVPYFKESASVLVEQADAALYQAKKEGRNRIKLA
jgi:diguanylate cyclase (GGDEF)-like protein